MSKQGCDSLVTGTPCKVKLPPDVGSSGASLRPWQAQGGPQKTSGPSALTASIGGRCVGSCGPREGLGMGRRAGAWCSLPCPHRHPVPAELLCVEHPRGRQVRDLHGSLWICLPQSAVPHRDRHAVEAEDLHLCLPEEAGAGEWLPAPPTPPPSSLGRALVGGAAVLTSPPALQSVTLGPPLALPWQRLSGRPPSRLSPTSQPTNSLGRRSCYTDTETQGGWLL